LHKWSKGGKNFKEESFEMGMNGTGEQYFDIKNGEEKKIRNSATAARAAAF
jgi:hypothetical protein